MSERPTSSVDQANEVLARLSGKLDAAVQGLRLSAGNDQTKVLSGFPFAVISREPSRAVVAGRKRVRNESVIRFSGTTLIVEDPLEGAYGAFTYTVMGQAFRDGVARVNGVRSANGGFLVYRYFIGFEIQPGGIIAAEPTATIQMLHYTSWQSSSFSVLTAGNHTNGDDLAVAVSPGTHFQLCAHYDRAGQVTIYQDTPQIHSTYLYGDDAAGFHNFNG